MNKIHIRLPIYLTTALILTLTWLSHQPSDISIRQQETLMRALEAFSIETQFGPLRDQIHVLVFIAIAGSAFIAFSQLMKSTGIKVWICTFALTLTVACADELHQEFVEGRGYQFKDLLHDGLGILLGSISAFLILTLVKKLITSSNS